MQEGPADGKDQKTYLRPLARLDEHTDWVNQLIYMKESDSLLSCSNDTTIKLWKVPETAAPSSDEAARTDFFYGLPAINSFSTFTGHQDYVRAMSYSSQSSRVFSISEDGHLAALDLRHEAILSEFDLTRKKNGLFVNSNYVPVHSFNENSKARKILY